MNRVIKTKTEHFWKGKDGIIRAFVLPGSEHTLEDAQENAAAFLKLSEGKKSLFFSDGTRMKSMTREARAEYSKGEHTTMLKAVALLSATPSPATAIINFIIKLNKPAFPTRFFTREEDAIDWLKSFEPDMTEAEDAIDTPTASIWKSQNRGFLFFAPSSHHSLEDVTKNINALENIINSNIQYLEIDTRFLTSNAPNALIPYFDFFKSQQIPTYLIVPSWFRRWFWKTYFFRKKIDISVFPSHEAITSFKDTL